MLTDSPPRNDAAPAALPSLAPSWPPPQVHRAWHDAGVAPKLLSTQPVGGCGSPFTMVVMEHLRPEDGWTSLHDAVVQDKLRAVCVEDLKAAVRKALEDAHAAPLAGDAAPARGAAKGVHGDMRRPNILVQIGSNGAIAGVRFIDFDWWVRGDRVLVCGMLNSHVCGVLKSVAEETFGGLPWLSCPASLRVLCTPLCGGTAPVTRHARHAYLAMPAAGRGRTEWLPTRP